MYVIYILIYINIIYNTLGVYYNNYNLKKIYINHLYFL